MGMSQSDLVPGQGANVRTLVAELRGRRVPTFVARDEEDPTKLSVVEHLTVDGAAKSAALARVSVLTGAPNPRLTRIRGAIERPRGIDVVSDFIDGELLYEVEASLRTNGTPIPTLCVLRVISDVLAGLHTLHGIPEFAASGHGNLSLRTVIVGMDGRVRLIELVHSGLAPGGDSAARFVAPEVLAGGATSPRGDVFAAGAMLAALLETGDPGDEVRSIVAVAERAVAPEPGDRFESAAAMLSALASTFRGAPSHADVARLMAATVGDQIRSRRAAAEKAPILAHAEVRDVLAPPPSMPIVFASEPLPGSRRASSWPSALQVESVPPSSQPFLGTAPPSSSPPSSRRTDRPPPGFGSVPASGAPLPLGVISPLPSIPAESTPAEPTAAASTAAVATAQSVARKMTKQPALTAPMQKPSSGSVVAVASPASTRSATPSAPAVRAAPPARSSTPSVVAAKPASSPALVAPPVRATAVMAAPVAPAPAPTPPPPPVTAPASVPSIPSIATTHPSPEAGPDSRPTDSWRYASAKPVEPPRRVVTLPVPDESIIVQDSSPDDDRTVRMMSPPSAPPSVRHLPSSPPGSSSTSLKLPAVELRAPALPRKQASKVVPMALVGLAVVGLATGGFALRARNKSTGENSSAAAGPRATATAPAVVAAVAGAAAPAATEKRCPDGTVLIEGGVFTMGSDAADASTGAKPAHSVTVSAFCMDVVEVSVGMFKACSDHGDCKRGLVTNDWTGITAAEHAGYEPLCTLRDPVGMASHPVNCVDWERADIYCTAHAGRLPTEAEWELAARGRDNRAYPWGNDNPSPTLVNGCGAECTAWAGKNAFELTALYDGTDSWLGTAPGKTFPAGNTPEGIADLAGNLAEWVADAYAPYTAAAQTDPVVTTGDLKVVRGGSFITGKRSALATTYRMREKPTKRSSTIGFRCVSPAGAPVAGR